MELTGIGVKNPITTQMGWAGRMPLEAKREAPAPAEGKKPSGPEFTDIGEVVAHQEEAVKAVADQLMAFLDATRYSLEFIPNQENGQVTIRVLNSAGKVIRQIPPEEINAMALQAGAATGLLVDEKLG
jgi:uncharacterized FlaG/YvyC family protein